MFCDLVGSTALSGKLDPEEMREVIRAYQDACSGPVARYDGFIAKFMGDGILAYFGFPRAHEDDAERAVRAGLDIVVAVERLRAPEPLKVRVRYCDRPRRGGRPHWRRHIAGTGRGR
jgi:class 3 adenylate cyclase